MLLSRSTLKPSMEQLRCTLFQNLSLALIVAGLSLTGDHRDACAHFHSRRRTYRWWRCGVFIHSELICFFHRVMGTHLVATTSASICRLYRLLGCKAHSILCARTSSEASRSLVLGQWSLKRVSPVIQCLRQQETTENSDTCAHLSAHITCES